MIICTLVCNSIEHWVVYTYIIYTYVQTLRWREYHTCKYQTRQCTHGMYVLESKRRARAFTVFYYHNHTCLIDIILSKKKKNLARLSYSWNSTLIRITSQGRGRIILFEIITLFYFMTMQTFRFFFTGINLNFSINFLSRKYMRNFT